MIEIIDAPFDLCGRRLGSRLGPIALRLEGLIPALEQLGWEAGAGEAACVVDRGLAPGQDQIEAQSLAALGNLKRIVGKSLANGNLPMVLGGDHSLSIGSVSAAMEEYGEKLGVLWIDAHMDLNTPAASPSGNLHGMSLAALRRMSDASDRWGKILDEVVPADGLESRIAWLGLRDVDQGERNALKQMPDAAAWTMHEIDLDGLARCVTQFDEWMKSNGLSHLWISFDVDSLDPIYAPGTGTAVRGGLTYREGHLLAELLRSHLDGPQASYRLAGVDVVEVNPLHDRQNETARAALEWVASLFGRRILDSRDGGKS